VRQHLDERQLAARSLGDGRLGRCLGFGFPPEFGVASPDVRLRLDDDERVRRRGHDHIFELAQRLAHVAIAIDWPET
jgi:hypothetical protein